MQIGIKLLPDGVERHDSMSLQHLLDRRLGQSNTLMQVQEIFVGGRGQSLGGDGAEGEGDDVDRRDEILCERGEGKVLGLLLFSYRNLLEGLKVGQGA